MHSVCNVLIHIYPRATACTYSASSSSSNSFSYLPVSNVCVWGWDNPQPLHCIAVMVALNYLFKKKKKESLCFSTIVRKKTEPLSRLSVATHEGKCGSEYKEILSSDKRIVNYKTMMNNDGLINNNTFMITSSYCCVFLMHFIFHEDSKTQKRSVCLNVLLM